MISASDWLGRCDVVWITLDTLRYDVAAEALRAGLTPTLAAILPRSGWELRHSPASFTYAAHQAFFAGFLPTPARPGPHPRLFALAFPGSVTTGPDTALFDAPDVVSGLASCGYHAACIGGVGFFNKLTPLGSVLPSLFAESHWSPELGVTCRESTYNQVQIAVDIARRVEGRLFLFLNVSALHQPNRIYLPGASEDSKETMAAALSYVDSQLPPLLDAFAERGPTLYVICSDHGTAYGEDGYVGHRLGHRVVWEVPYAELLLERQ